MSRRHTKTPTPAATGMGVGNRKLAGRRFTPSYLNPFDPAIPVGPLFAAIVREADRRMHVAARARAVKS